MTITEIQSLSAELGAAILKDEGTTEQARLRGLTVETFGLTHNQDHLIAKLRTMSPERRAEIGMKP